MGKQYREKSLFTSGAHLSSNPQWEWFRFIKLVTRLSYIKYWGYGAQRPIGHMAHGEGEGDHQTAAKGLGRYFM
jgi:hypothetical protein